MMMFYRLVRLIEAHSQGLAASLLKRGGSSGAPAPRKLGVVCLQSRGSVTEITP